MHLAYVFCMCYSYLQMLLGNVTLNTLYMFVIYMPQHNYSNNLIRCIDPHNMLQPPTKAFNYFYCEKILLSLLFRESKLYCFRSLQAEIRSTP